MKGRDLVRALNEGEIIYGTCLEGYGQPRWPRYFDQIGLDYVFLDTEHTPQNRETVAWTVQAYAALGIAPLVRIPNVSASLAAQTLDLGTHGIVAPYIETVDQVKEMVGAVKYRPLKGDALEKLLNQKNSLNEKTSNYLTEYNQDAVLWIMIESLAGITELDEMLSIKGIDGVLIGPHDLSVSCGVPEQYEHPRFIESVERVIRLCKEHSISVGIHVSWGDLVYERTWIQKGCNIVLHSSDTFCFASNLARELNALREDTDLNIEPSTTIDGRKGHAV
jgi:2-keto-3-deoxy-L-rhamnonate aldolase RhmA